jgi:hypothetical protein
MPFLKAGGLSTAFDVGGIFGSPIIGIFLGRYHLLYYVLFASNIFHAKSYPAYTNKSIFFRTYDIIRMRSSRVVRASDEPVPKQHLSWVRCKD